MLVVLKTIFIMLYDGTDLGHTRKIEFCYVIRFTANGVLDCVYKVNPTVLQYLCLV